MGTGVAVPVLVPIIKWWLDRKNKNLENINDNLNDLNVKIDNLQEKTEANADGTKQILRYRLIKDMGKAINKGYVCIKDLTEINNLYESYKSLGGNSVVDEIYSKYVKLPIKED